MNTLHPRMAAAVLAVVCSTLLLSACGDKNAAPASGDKGKGPTEAPAAPAVPVSTTVATQRPFDMELEATGTVTPVSAVDVKPQVTSVVTQVHVKEGQTVKAGDLLFTLDTRADQANVAKLQAQLAKDQALLADAQRQLARARDLQSKNFVSQGSVDTTQANVDSLQATLAADRAAVDAARVPLSYGQVRAASGGRIGAIPVFVGTAVQANVTLMATVIQMNPIDVAFSLPQANLGALLGRLKSEAVQVKARQPDGKAAWTGKVVFVDNAVDAATGTVKVKARFDNAENRLWPGAFVKVALQTQHLDNAVVVPTQAVIQSARGAIVYVAREGKALLRPVKLLAVQGEDAAVSGIEAGDKVVVNGRQNLRPDAAITERAPDAEKSGKAGGTEGGKDSASGASGAPAATGTEPTGSKPAASAVAKPTDKPAAP